MKKNARAIALLLCMIVALSTLCACDKAVTGEETTAEVIEPEEELTGIILGMEGSSAFTIIRHEDCDTYEVKCAKRVKSVLSDAIGCTFEIATDWVKGNGVVENDNLEILVGSTNRKETADVLEEIGIRGYAMKIVNNKLVIAATNSAFLTLAVEEFEKIIIKNAKESNDGSAYILYEDCFVVRPEGELQLSDYIAAGENFSVNLTPVIYAPAEDIYKVAQGAASDGTYVYFLLRTSADGDGIIVKYNLETKEKVAKSKPFHVFHGNDMTYCKSQNLLYVVHGSTEGKILTTVNPDTLEVVTQTVNITKGAGAITYSWQRDSFAFSQGGSSLNFMTTDYTVTKALSKGATSGYTAQGMGSDESYIYFPMSGSSDNILMVYDWNGKYITDVHLPSKKESESMFWVNDTYYVNFYNSGNGAMLCELSVIPE